MDADAPDSSRLLRKRAEFLTGELIGLRVGILRSKRKGQAGLEGTVADETKNTLVLRTKAGDEKTIAKAGCIFVFEDYSEVRVPGEWLIARPEDRTKKVADLLCRKKSVGR